MKAKWQAHDPDAFAAQEERRSSWRRAKRGGVVASGVVAGGGELPGSSSVSDGHPCLPRALAVRAMTTLRVTVVSLIVSGTHGHVFLELCCASDSELAAPVVEHSVAIRVTSFEDLQLTSTRPALHRMLMLCKAHDVVANI